MTSPTDSTSASSPHFLKATRSGSSKIPVSTIVSRSRSPVQSATTTGLSQPSQKPYWVGPPAPSRPTTSGIPTMTQRVKITYSHAGLQPPVYIAGSLGDQPWEPVEMCCTRQEDGEHDFWQEFDVEEGEYQYKFRLGPGDWWALDETKHIVDDGAGNRNNLLVVKPQPFQASPVEDHSPAAVQDSQSAQSKAEEAHTASHAIPSIHEPVPSTSNDAQSAAEKNLISHEALGSDVSGHDYANDEEQAPAFAHEAAHGSPVKIVKSLPQDDEEDHAPFFRHETTTTAADGQALVFDDDEDDDDYEVASPLLRHESLTPLNTNHQQDGGHGVPLFNHESMSPIETRTFSSSRSARSNSASSRDVEPNPFDDNDLNDPSLERFPTERDDIMAHLHRASSRVSEDDDAIDAAPASPSMSSTRSLSAAASPALSVPRESTEHLDIIDEDEELSPEDPTEQQGLGIKPAEEKKEPAPKLSISPSHEPVNRGPLTPPMTPIDELQAKSGILIGSLDAKQFDSPSQTEVPEQAKVAKDTPTKHVSSQSTSKASLNSTASKDDQSKINSFWGWVGKICGDRVGSLGIAMAVGVAAAFYAMTGRSSSA